MEWGRINMDYFKMERTEEEGYQKYLRMLEEQERQLDQEIIDQEAKVRPVLEARERKIKQQYERMLLEEKKRLDRLMKNKPELSQSDLDRIAIDDEQVRLEEIASYERRIHEIEDKIENGRFREA